MSNTRLSRFAFLWQEWIKPTLLLLVVLTPLRSAVVDWNWVPSGSMKPTILVGDLVGVNKLAYDLKVPFTSVRLARWARPARGDIVVFFSPTDGTRLVKRVIGLPGDTVAMRNDIVFINGSPLGYSLEDLAPFGHELAESAGPIVATEHLEAGGHLIAVLPDRPAMRSFAPRRVPDGEYFMMGDCRDNSNDSRYFGPVQSSAIVGRASLVIVSFDPSRFFLPRFGRTFHPLGLQGG